jgi:hypothetical protein
MSYVVVRWASSLGDPGQVIELPATAEAVRLVQRRGLMPMTEGRPLVPCETCGANFVDARLRQQHQQRRHRSS